MSQWFEEVKIWYQADSIGDQTVLTIVEIKIKPIVKGHQADPMVDQTIITTMVM